MEKIFPSTRQGDCQDNNFGARCGGVLLLLRLARISRFSLGLACWRNNLLAIFKVKNFASQKRGAFFFTTGSFQKNFTQVVDLNSNVR